MRTSAHLVPHKEPPDSKSISDISSSRTMTTTRRLTSSAANSSSLSLSSACPHHLQQRAIRGIHGRGIHQRQGVRHGRGSK
ncbi:hypothetical protein BV20DRAFT_858957 [Pilatotrama ljubarskyi]|nr:hypothetical protein BV20DRAFT_858957 [Pilatotrama ljubarskyi]